MTQFPNSTLIIVRLQLERVLHLFGIPDRLECDSGYIWTFSTILSYRLVQRSKKILNIVGRLGPACETCFGRSGIPPTVCDPRRHNYSFPAAPTRRETFHPVR